MRQHRVPSRAPLTFVCFSVTLHQGDGTCDPSLNGTARGWSTTWGGRPIQDPSTGDWHYHVAEMANHCGMCSWASVSQVAHYVSRAPTVGAYRRSDIAASRASVTGPYTRVDTAIPVFAHNPIVAAVPDSTDGAPDKYIMLHIGSGESSGHPPVCTNGTTPKRTDASEFAHDSTSLCELVPFMRL